MNEKNFALAEGFVSSAYMKLAAESRRGRESLVTILLSQRRLPLDGWDEESIELFLHECASMDSNNFQKSAGVGEREARIASSLVSRRYFRLGHGVGRSGDLAAEQPKAAGSSLIQKLANCLALDAVHIAGVTRASAAVVVPLATGMSLSLCLLSLRQKKPSAKYVIWPRVDQKTCLKSIIASACTPLVVENLHSGDELVTDIDAIERLIQTHGVDSIVCVISTTSVFAPRAPDKVVESSILCKRYGLAHLVNNAYGLQASKTCHELNEACRTGRVDAVVQSSDKNFLVPVGGAVIFSPSSHIIDDISQTYPGRGSVSAVLDILITLLELGATGFKKLLADRKENYTYFKARLHEVAERFSEKVLESPHNPISLGLSLSSLGIQRATQLGSVLFTRRVSGSRVVTGSAPSKSVCTGFSFPSYGAHCDSYHTPYVTFAATLGQSREEIDLCITRFEKSLSDLLSKPSF